MKHTTPKLSRPARRLLPTSALLLAAGLVLPACEEEGIRSYETSKDPAAQQLQTRGPMPDMPGLAVTPPPAATTAPDGRGASGVDWPLPEGWAESAEGRPMRLATFIATAPPTPAEENNPSTDGESSPDTPDTPAADTPAAEPLEIALSAFPDDVGGPLANLNRWRGQLGLDPVTQDQLPEHFDPLDDQDPNAGAVATIDGRAPHSDLGETDVRMLVAMVPDAGRTWFLKAVGLPSQIETHRAAFLQFARTLPPSPQTLGAASPTPPPTSSPPAATTTGPVDPAATGHAANQTHWNAPPHWQPEPGQSAMLKGAYIAPNADGQTDPAAAARITLMSLPGDGGGALPNINRWRAQLGLPALQSLDQQPVTRLNVNGSPGALLDLVGTPPAPDPANAPPGMPRLAAAADGQPTRTLVALVARPTETWFIKMSGPDSEVQAQRQAFQDLLNSIHFH